MKTLAAIFASIVLYASGAHAQCAGVTSIERSSETIGPEEQIRTLMVEAPAGCVWNAAPTERFVQIVSKPASGSGTLTYRVTANPFTTVRGAQIQVEQFALSITQNAAATPKPFRGDINGDGLVDAFSRFGDFNKAYQVWFGAASNQGPWNRITVHDGDAGMVVAMGDFNGDGHAGYALYDPASLQVRIAFVSEGGVTTIVPVRAIVSTSWEIVGAGDFDGDRKSDLLLRNVEQGLLSIWFMNGAAVRDFPLVDTRIVSPAWQIAGIADFDGDLKSDILLRNVLTGNLSIWKMNGASMAGNTDVPWLALPWVVTDVGDFDGDGDFDLLYRHGVTGAIEYHLMSGFAVTSIVPHPAPVPPVHRVLSIGDIDGDGQDDVALQSMFDSPSQSFVTMGSAVQHDLSSGPFGLFTSRYRRRAAVNDFNGDGRSDFLLRHATSNEVATWEMNGTTVLRSSIFARVTSSEWHFQQIGAFSGDLMSDVQLNFQPPHTNYLAMWELAGQTVLNSNEIGIAGGRLAVGSGDFDGDGNADLLLRSFTSLPGEYEVWLMAGHTVRSKTIVGMPETGETFDCVGDFDADGLADIVLRNASGQYIGWLMAGPVRRERRILGQLDPNWKTLGIIDLFGDGVAEILQRSPNTDEVAIAYYRPGYGMNGSIVGGAGLNGKYQAAGDYDGDGVPEIVVRNSSNGAMTMWFISGIYVYSRQTFANVASPQWQIQGAFEPTPIN